MLTSNVTSSVLRPASPGAATAYRSTTVAVTQAAARAGISYPLPPKNDRLNTSRYEFPGDRTYQRYLGGL